MAQQQQPALLLGNAATAVAGSGSSSNGISNNRESSTRFGVGGMKNVETSATAATTLSPSSGQRNRKRGYPTSGYNGSGSAGTTSGTTTAGYTAPPTSRIGSAINSFSGRRRSSHSNKILYGLQYVLVPFLFFILIGSHLYMASVGVGGVGSGGTAGNEAGSTEHGIHQVLHQHQNQIWSLSNSSSTAKGTGRDKGRGGGKAALKAYAAARKERVAMMEAKASVVVLDPLRKTGRIKNGGESTPNKKPRLVPKRQPGGDNPVLRQLSAKILPEYEHSKRTLPHDTKITYLLHIHKSAGTLLCQLAHHNQMSASLNNCNVQRDQRCCGNADTFAAQVAYWNESHYDFVASEGRMYDTMDYQHYNYIVVLRNSKQRYFSHWKHARRTYMLLPNFDELNDGGPPVLVQAAGGIKQSAKDNKERPIPDNVPPNQEDVYNHMMDMMDLERGPTKEERKAKREEKMRQIEEWKQKKQKDQQQLLQQAKNNRRRLEEQQKVKQEQGQEQSTTATAGKKDTPLSASYPKDAAPHADKHQDSNKTNNNTTNKTSNNTTISSDHIVNHYQHQKHAAQARARSSDWGGRPPMMPHPADEPSFDVVANRFILPVVGINHFRDWWIYQPDNWNFRQLCGPRCVGVPKYQLTMELWTHVIEKRLLRFHTILFLEPNLQDSVTVLTKRLGWKIETNLQHLAELNDKEAERKAMFKEAKRLQKVNQQKGKKDDDLDGIHLDSLKSWYKQAKEKQLKHKHRHDNLDADGVLNPKRQMKDWDPLMSALDDAMYDIGKRWEQIKLSKQQKKKTTDHFLVPEDLDKDELSSLVDIASLSTKDLQDTFQRYMEEEPNNHRTQCHNECCAARCSAW